MRLQDANIWLGIGLLESYINHNFGREFIYNDVPPGDAFKAIRSGILNPKDPSLKSALQSPGIFDYTSKVVALLEVSQTWGQFLKLNDQLRAQTNPDKQDVDFDQALKNILNTKK